MNTSKGKKSNILKLIFNIIRALLKTVFGPSIQFLKQKAKVIYIPGFQGINLYQVIRFLAKQLNAIGVYDRASAISFNLLMALPAGFLFLFSILRALSE